MNLILLYVKHRPKSAITLCCGLIVYYVSEVESYIQKELILQNQIMAKQTRGGLQTCSGIFILKYILCLSLLGQSPGDTDRASSFPQAL